MRLPWFNRHFVNYEAKWRPPLGRLRRRANNPTAAQPIMAGSGN